MTILAIDHVELAMPPGREDYARSFCSGLLGVPELPKPEFLELLESASAAVRSG